MAIKTRQILCGELVAGGLNLADAQDVAARLSPYLDSYIERAKPMLTYLNGVSFDSIATRINAKYPKITKGDYALYSVTTQAIKAHPDFSEDQIFTLVEKSFMPASAGGNLVTKAESAAAIAARAQQRVYTMVAVVAVVGVGAWMIFKGKKR